MIIRFLIMVIIFTSTIFAQTKLSKEQIFEDYTIFKNILTSGHPALYEYTSEDKWDSLFNNFEKSPSP